MPQIQTRHYQCRHIFTDGHRCGSKCLRNEDFCYYHHTGRRPAPPANLFRDANSSFTVPIPEDRSAIQAGIGIVLQRIAENQLDPRRAGLLLYGLQIAAFNLPKPRLIQRESVDQVTEDPILGVIAPVSVLNNTLVESFEKLIQRRLGAQKAMPFAAGDKAPLAARPSTE